ncbi:SGNH/GDSL hydrolase family protein [Formosa sp. A9]|uniref:SGNH/GDSL hydrolase family protein n=1 Tax=Formosa sp. A9 TaxID=3442641 RepID=UPI003EBF3663
MKKQTRRQFVKHIGMLSAAGLATHPVLSHSFTEAVNRFPEKDSSGLTILFQGDSITDGNRTRHLDWNHVMGHGFAYLISSRLWCDYPEQELMFYNRGVSGNTINDLNTRWQDDTIDLKPDIVNILIGVNDILAAIPQGNLPIEQMETDYRALLTRTKNALPDAKIVLCEPFILDVGHVTKQSDLWHNYTKQVQQLVKQLANEFNAVHIAFQKHFDAACLRAKPDYWIWDGIHPMPAGHELMARVWIEQMKPNLPFIK